MVRAGELSCRDDAGMRGKRTQNPNPADVDLECRKPGTELAKSKRPKSPTRGFVSKASRPLWDLIFSLLSLCIVLHIFVPAVE